MKTRTNTAKELAALKDMTPKQLRERYAELYSEPSRSGNRQWLFRRCAWRPRHLWVRLGVQRTPGHPRPLCWRPAIRYDLAVWLACANQRQTRSVRRIVGWALEGADHGWA